MQVELDEEDLARAGLYALLGQLLANPPDRDLLTRCAALRGTDTPLGQALDELAGLAAATGADAAEHEYNALFIGVDRGELVPYASFYLTGFLHDRPLARLRRDMQALGVERRSGVAEPEDHIACLCEIMAGLITGTYGNLPAADEASLFRRHLAPWAERFFGDLERARAAALYRPVGALGRIFLAIEASLLPTMPPGPHPDRAGAAARASEGG
jgi:TorA maturation chaperone TorD